jgi:LAGLIDADG DNA endonuclease family
MPGVFLYSNKRLTNNERSSFSISPYINEVIIGLSLGDLNINRQTNRNYARLSCVQGSINEAYILHLYALFKDYCGTPPKNKTRKPDIRTGKIYNWIRFNTYSLPCF